MRYTVSLLAKQASELAIYGPGAAEGADLVEVRLDHALDGDLQEWGQAMVSLGKPLIVSLHGPAGLGSVAGTPERHLSVLRVAAGFGAEFVDVDHSLADGLTDLPGSCGRIVSMHLTGPFTGIPTGEFERLVDRAQDSDVIKFVVAAGSALQGLQVMDWARSLAPRPAGRLLFCMGERVAFTRPMARAFGDPWMYVAPSAVGPWQQAARGQLDLDQALASKFPEPGENPGFQGVLGHPIDHSLSPEVHGAALAASGENVTFLAVDPGDLDECSAFMDAALDFGFQGFAVTAPFKTLALAGAASELAREVGAANTLVRRGGNWWADNTDVAGIQRALESGWPGHASRHGLSESMGGRSALIVGTGGAARAARAACVGLGLSVQVCARREKSCELWTAEFGDRALLPANVRAGEHDVIIQTTPVGWGGVGMALPPSALVPAALVLDAVYHPERTPLLASAEWAGASTMPGRDWFLGQAAQQFEILNGHAPQNGAMGAAMQGALERRHGGGAPEPDKPLTLIGMRAVGKTTLGRSLARALGRRFFDADEELARTFAQRNPDSPWSTAGQILDGIGLQGFRELEQEVLDRLLDGEGSVVIATGGGVVETPVCRTWLAERATCIWLDLPPAALQSRLETELGDRPGLTAAGPVGEVPEFHGRRLGWYGALARMGLRGDGFPRGELPGDWVRALTSCLCGSEWPPRT